MDIISTPDEYSPSLNELGQYVDCVPPASKFTNGLRCLCGSRKDHVYDTRTAFCAHIKSKSHIKWILEINANRNNFLTESIRLQELVDNQKLIIAKLQKETSDHIRLIAHLTRKIELKENPTILTDLLIFD